MPRLTAESNRVYSLSLIAIPLLCDMGVADSESHHARGKWEVWRCKGNPVGRE